MHTTNMITTIVYKRCMCVLLLLSRYLAVTCRAMRIHIMPCFSYAHMLANIHTHNASRHTYTNNIPTNYTLTWYIHKGFRGKQVSFAHMVHTRRISLQVYSDHMTTCNAVCMRRLCKCACALVHAHICI